MSWIYNRRNGQLEHNGRAYSGSPTEPVAAPALRPSSHDGHPALPSGRYRIGSPFTHARTGAFTLGLTPSVTNHAAHRHSYLIHGPHPGHPADAAHGSLVLPLSLRRLIWTSGDRSLEVVT